jgi:hypothetical protein
MSCSLGEPREEEKNNLTPWGQFPTTRCGFVIRAKAGIRVGTFFLDTRLPECDGCYNRLETPQLAAGWFISKPRGTKAGVSIPALACWP